MFYKIAIVQNEKEVFKYDCADWSNLFKNNSNFSFYKLAYFDEHNIDKLLGSLLIYDAVFFATNSFNSSTIYEACTKKRDEIEDFINAGKGLYIGYSSKNKAHEFLPEQYRLEQKERDFISGESEMDGELQFAMHPLTQAHNKVSLVQYENIAKHHTTIAGLYFDYLDFGDRHNSLFDKIVVDNHYEYERVLLASTKISTGTRVVVSTLPVDWQKQTSLFVNMVKYCTEGEPIIKIISKQGLSNNDFSREYLSRQLNLYKRAFLFESVDSLEDVSLDCAGLETIIFDCDWEDKDVDFFCERNLDEIYNKNIRILHYYNYRSINDPIYKLTVHSAFQQVDLIEEGVLIAIQERTPGEKNKYSYDSSLLTTYEAIKLLQQNGIRNEALYSSIVTTGKKRLLSDGSYDAMFVASNNFYAVWALCDDMAENDASFTALRNYIRKALFKNKDDISSFEKAQALYFLKDTGVLTSEEQTQLLMSLVNTLTLANQEDVFSYGISNCWYIFSENISLINNNQLNGVKLEALVKNLLSLLGDLKKDCKIVVLSNYIITLTNLIRHGIVTQDNDLHILYRLLFSSIEEMYDRKDGVLWNDDIYSSCFAVKALKRFSELSTYPIDEILTLSQPNSLIYSFEKEQSRFDYTMILESTNQQTNELISVRSDLEKEKARSAEREKNIKDLEMLLRKEQNDKSSMENELQQINKELQHATCVYRKKKAVDIIGRIAIVGLVFFIIQMLYVAINHKDIFINYCSSFNGFLSWVLVGISTIVTVITFVSFFKKKE